MDLVSRESLRLFRLVYPDGKRNTSGQKLPDVNLEDTGIPQRLQTHELSQTLHTPRHGSGYTQLPLEVGCCVGVREEYLGPSPQGIPYAVL